MNKVTKPGVVMLWNDELVEVVGIGNGKTIHMRPIGAKPCEHCGETKEYSVLEGCPNWQEGVKPVPTLE